MLNKKVLGVAVAAALSSVGANAAIDLDADTGGQLYAAETLVTTATTMDLEPVPNTFYNVVSTGTNMDINALIGLGVSTGNQVFVRYDFDGAILAAPAPIPLTGTAGVKATTQSVAQGGLVGNDFVIYDLTATADILQTEGLTFPSAPGGQFAIATSGSASVTMRIYSTVNDAINNPDTSALNTATMGGAIGPTDGIGETYTNNTLVADVETGFTQLVASTTAPLPTTTLGQLGGTVVAATAGALDASDGLAVTLADMIGTATSMVAYSGDFSVGTYTMQGGGAVPCDGTGTTSAAVVNTALDTLMTTVADSNTNPFLCLGVVGNTMVIPEGTYDSTVTYVPIAAAAAPALGSTGDSGVIDHNGTTVQLPYLTTFADYNQRIVVVNRGNSDVAYTMSFRPETGTTATAGTAATGTLAGDAQTIIRVTDTVTLSGATRTAGTLVIVTPEANIDVVTTQVNLVDGGTDTVKYK